MASAPFLELIRAMIQDAGDNIRRLRQQADLSQGSDRLNHTMNDVLHAELLRLEMLKAIVAEAQNP